MIIVTVINITADVRGPIVERIPIILHHFLCSQLLNSSAP